MYSRYSNDLNQYANSSNIPFYREQTTRREYLISNKNFEESMQAKCVKFETQQGNCYKIYDAFQFKWVTKCEEKPIKNEYTCTKKRIRNFYTRIRVDVPNSKIAMLQNPKINQCLNNNAILREIGQRFQNMIFGMNIISEERLTQALNEARDSYIDKVGACLAGQYNDFWSSLSISATTDKTVISDWKKVN